ncbi:MAG: hypothetical protein LAO77_15620 [Acidobacteriia bacterium]|nr:hypothetical protein [Terriglobia bacterium]
MTKKMLARDNFGRPVFPTVVPTASQDLLDMMDDAGEYAGQGQGAGAPAFDNGTRLFSQLNAHFQVRMVSELAEAHVGLKTATNTLKIATWWLAGITVLLGGVEVFKLWKGH